MNILHLSHSLKHLENAGFQTCNCCRNRDSPELAEPRIQSIPDQFYSLNRVTWNLNSKNSLTLHTCLDLPEIKMPPRRDNTSNNEMATLLSQSLAAVLPGVMNQIFQNINNGNGINGNHGNNNNPYNFKQFNSCNPPKYTGNEGATGLLQWTESMENTFRHSQCTNERKVEFASSVFQKRALTWWTGIMKDRTAEVAMAMTWEELKDLMLKDFCPRNEMKALEDEFHNLNQDSGENRAYTNRFMELLNLCTTASMLTPDRLIEKYIGGLPTCIKHIVTGSKPTTLRDASELSATLTDAHVKEGNLTRKSDKKAPQKGSSGSSKAAETGAQSSRNSRKRKAANNFAVTTSAPVNQTTSPPAKKQYTGNAPLCNKCNFHHQPQFPCRMCTNCGRIGHWAVNCRIHPTQNRAAATLVAPVANTTRHPIGTCFYCGDPSHFKHDCPKLANTQQARGRAFNINTNEARTTNDVVNGDNL